MDWGIAIGGVTLGLSLISAALVIGRKAGELSGEVRALRGEVHGVTEWLTKVEATGVKQGEQLADLRTSVARVEGTLNAEARARRDSDKTPKASAR